MTAPAWSETSYTGISWADNFRPNAEQWFDRQMNDLEEFEVTLTFCFTPNTAGLRRTTRVRHWCQANLRNLRSNDATLRAAVVSDGSSFKLRATAQPHQFQQQ